MGLCGSYRCGCAVTALTPSGATAINGHTPDIEALGSGEPGDQRTAVLNVPWANEVANIRTTIDNNPGLSGEWVEVDLYFNWPDQQGSVVSISRTGGTFDSVMAGYCRYRQLAGSFAQVVWNIQLISGPSVQGSGAFRLLLPFSGTDGYGNPRPTVPGAATWILGWGPGRYVAAGGTVYTGQWSPNGEPSGSGEYFPSLSMQVFGGYGTSQLGSNPSVNLTTGDKIQGSIIYQDDRQTAAPV